MEGFGTPWGCRLPIVRPGILRFCKENECLLCFCNGLGGEVGVSKIRIEVLLNLGWGGCLCKNNVGKLDFVKSILTSTPSSATSPTPQLL